MHRSGKGEMVSVLVSEHRNLETAMTPRAERTPHLFIQIANHYRQKIRDGLLATGTKLPSIKAISAEWGVAPATTVKAIGQLQVEGYVRSSPRGTYVSDDFKAASTPHDRLLRVGRTGSMHAEGEHVRTLAAEIVKPPLYVAELFGFDDPGAQVVRRESVTIRNKRAASLSVTWHPAEYAELVPELLNQGPESSSSKGAPMIHRIEAALGRPLTGGRDDIEAREADPREANHLGLRVGSPVLCVVHRWTSGNDLIEYGEQCLPPKHVIGYEYDLTEVDAGQEP